MAEAVRRLPAEIHDRRMFRIVRAIQLDLMRSELPPEQWTTYDDVSHHFEVSFLRIENVVQISNVFFSPGSY